MVSLVLLALAASAHAAFTIVYPSPSAYWVANSSNTYQWTTAGNDNPGLFSVYLSNVQSGVILNNNGAAQLGLSNNIDAATGTITIPFLPDYAVGDGFQLYFTNVYNASDVFVSSGIFTIQPEGTTYAQTSNVAPGNSGQFNTVTSSASVAGVVIRTSAGSQSSSVSDGNGIPNSGGAANTPTVSATSTSTHSNSASHSASSSSTTSSAGKIAQIAFIPLVFSVALLL